MYLSGQLSGRSQDQSKWTLLPSAISIATWWGTFGSVLEDPVKDWDQEGGGLAGASLGAGHEVPLGQDDGDAVLLHRGGAGVVGQLNIGLGR